MIEIIDNFLSRHQSEQVVKYCYNSLYYYGERDTRDASRVPTGMVNEIDITSEIYKLLKDNTQHLVPDLEIYRMYVNCFSPGEWPFFHSDGDSVDEFTFLYYVPTAEWDVDDGGETQLIVNNEIKGIMPIPNRMLYFNANIVHKATSFRNRWRWTLAIKYGHKI